MNSILSLLSGLGLSWGGAFKSPPPSTNTDRKKPRLRPRRSIVIDGERHQLRGLARTLNQARVDAAMRNARNPVFGLRFMHPRHVRAKFLASDS